MTASILPPGYLPTGGKLYLTDREEQEIRQALSVISPRRVRRALAQYSEERKHVEGKKATTFLYHVGADLDKRGLRPLQIQLINVTAAQSWDFFRGFLNQWLKKVEAQDVPAVCGK